MYTGFLKVRRASSRGLLASELGNVALVTAIAMPLLIGSAGLGVETSYWYYKQLQLQSAADTAAYAAGLEKRSGSDIARITLEGSRTALKNGYDGKGSLVVNSPPLSGPNMAKPAVEILIQENVNRYFSRILASTPVTMKARAVAVFQTAANACILALSKSASRAALFSGSSDVNLIGCDVMSNSIASDSIKVQGSAKLSTPCLIATGGIQTTSGATLTECSSPITQAPPVADPYADLPAPVDPGSCKSSAGATLQPGKYCGGLSLSGNVALQSGVYIITGGDLKINANAKVTGTNVTFYLTNGAHVSMNGNATIQISAPETGTYAGVLFFGDRASTGGNNTFNGTADSFMTGAIYFAKENVNYLGNFSGADGCTQIVALTIEWSGHTNIKQDCSAHGMRTVPALQLVRLVE